MRFGLIAALAASVVAPPMLSAQTRQQAAPRAAARPAAPAARSAQPAGLQVPPAAALIVLIRGSLEALNQANQTGLYDVFYALGSDGMRSHTNPQSLAQSFAAFRQRGVDLSPVLFLNPTLTQQPAIQGNRLHLVGGFPSEPLQITFDMWFEPSQNRWKLVQLNTNLTPAQQAQPKR